MIDELKPYPEYKDSGQPWIGKVPAHWDVRRQRNLVEMLVSNVDKHTIKGETPVRLCNYVDVYKNELITERIPFMRATARLAEIERFRLRKDDVIITKDSEEWNDIGVPALVAYTAPDLVCGYHLAILRSRGRTLCGPYLLRALQSQGVASQYHVAANGVTRYGLSHDSIKSVVLPLPSPGEQTAIVQFLNQANLQMDRFIRVKKRVIALLDEQKQAIIHHAVIRGLDPGIRLKPSGILWLSDIPKHWKVIRIKYVLREVDHRSTSGSETLLSMRMRHGLVPFAEHFNRPPQAATLVGFKIVRPGQFVVNRMQAGNGLIYPSKLAGLVSPDYAVFEPVSDVNVDFLGELFRSRTVRAKFRAESKGLGTGSSGFLRLYNDRLGAIHIALPQRSEQDSILSGLGDQLRDLNTAIVRTEREIGLIREWRTRLLADVVTGKLDVRAAASQLPAETTEAETVAEAETEAENEELVGAEGAYD